MPEHLEHLDEGDRQVQVHEVAEVQRERHEEADGQDARKVEVPRQRPLHLHQLEDLRPGVGRRAVLLVQS